MGWLSGWSYRKSHVIEGSSAGAQSNYQVRIKVHRSSGTDSGEDVYVESNCNEDYSDIRFTRSDGTTLLDYWIQESDSTVATIWVEVHSIPASPGSTTIYLYYGNSDASGVSDGDATFVFFDHFDGTALDTDKWNVKQGSTDDLSFSNSVMRVMPQADVAARVLLQGKNTQLYNLMACFKSRAYNDTVRWGSLAGMIKYNAGYNSEELRVYTEETSNSTSFRSANGGTTTTNNGISVSTVSDWHIYAITWKSGEGKFYQNWSLKSTLTSNIPDEAMGAYIWAADADTDPNDWIEFDWCFLKNWSDPEPSHGSWGSEENTPPPYLGGLRVRAPTDPKNSDALSRMK